jgi:hypothetical protein
MEAEFLRRFARQMRELMLRARTEAAREQLRIWAEEFDERAGAVDTQPGDNRAGDHRAGDHRGDRGIAVIATAGKRES